MKETHNSYRERIERSKERLADLEERGIEAMSRYDVEIASGGDAQMALDQAKGFVRSHIISDTARLDELGEEVRQLDLFGLPAVADVFDASRLGGDDQATRRVRRGKWRTKGLA